MFALEKGVCALCKVDAHKVFLELAALEPAERLQRLLGTPWLATAAQRIVERPTEGDFWQADHQSNFFKAPQIIQD